MEVAIKKLQIVAAENDDNEDSNDIIVKRFIYEASKKKILKYRIKIINIYWFKLSIKTTRNLNFFTLKMFQTSEFCKFFVIPLSLIEKNLILIEKTDHKVPKID